MRLREEQSEASFETDRGWVLFLSHISAYRIIGGEVWATVDAEAHVLTDSAALDFLEAIKDIEKFK